MFFARELPPQTRVLFVEKGQRHTNAERVAKRGQFGAETFNLTNTSGHPKEWIANSTFGGNSNCWWACTPRFHPDDFRLNTRHGVGLDWPLAYDDLEEIYCDVERIMDINGAGSDTVLPRSQPFPSPPLRPSLSDKALREHSNLWWAQPTARSTGTRRLPCCGNGVCDLCPIDSKFTILNSLDQFERPDFHYLTGAELRTMARTGGTATSAHIRMTDGREAEIAADLFAEAADARKLEADTRKALDGAAIDVIVQPAAPILVTLTAAPQSTTVGQVVTFTAAVAQNPSNIPVQSVAFTFGDGNSRAPQASLSTSHIYGAPGNYLAHTTVRFVDGTTAQASVAVRVQ